LRSNYVIKDGKIVRTNPFCPRCGEGVFMADKGIGGHVENAETDTTKSDRKIIAKIR